MNKKRLLNSTICCVFILTMSACNVVPFKQQNEQKQEVAMWATPEEDPVVTEEDPDETVIPSTAQTTPQKRQQIIEIGNGQYTAPAKQNTYKESTDGDITLNFQSTDINEFVKVILSDLLNENYIIDPQVNGTVTIETGRPISKRELFSLLDEILAINNAAIIRTGDLYKVVPRNKAVRGHLSPLDSTSSVDGYSVRTIPLAYIAAQEMQKILEPFVSEGGEIRVDKQRNMLILAGTAEELNTLQDTIDIFDVDWLRGMSVGLYPLDHIDPETLKAELDAILGGVEGSSGDELLGGLVRTIAIERLNSLLLISSTAAALREAELWLYRLDRAGETIGQHLYVYEVQNAKAIELADILGHIFGNGDSSSFSSSANLAPGTTPVEISENDSSSNQDNPSPSPSVSISGDDVSLVVNDSIEIIADDTRNALVILATPQDYKMVAAAIQKLDIVPMQVLIEASILEVTLNDDLNYGVEWFFKNGLNDNYKGQGQLDLGDAAIAALAPSFSYTIVNNASNVRVALNALQTESEINVLSSPSLMVLDNQTATINIGDEIPVPSRQSVSNIDPNAPTVNEIQYRNTGVTLEVTPRVNNSGLVTMDIKQEVSNAVTTTSSSIDAPTIQQRQIESTVAINTGETIVLGGLMQESDTESESGVPGLYKIPLIGKLFGQTNNSFRKTELIVLLTPRVIRSNIDAKKITDEFRKKLQNLPPI